jgi:hypothetical protein
MIEQSIPTARARQVLFCRVVKKLQYHRDTPVAGPFARDDANQQPISAAA